MSDIYNTLNSTYEVDTDRQQMRRIAGTNRPVVGPDGVWQDYNEMIVDPAYGGLVFHLANNRWLQTTPAVLAPAVSA